MHFTCFLIRLSNEVDEKEITVILVYFNITPGNLEYKETLLVDKHEEQVLRNVAGFIPFT